MKTAGDILHEAREAMQRDRSVIEQVKARLERPPLDANREAVFLSLATHEANLRMETRKINESIAEFEAQILKWREWLQESASVRQDIAETQNLWLPK